jgi:hypothetical protein
MQSKSDIPRKFFALYSNARHWNQQENTRLQNQSRNLKMGKLIAKLVLLNISESPDSAMGYSSKRRRSKRRRTRTLNAMHSLNLPDDSSLEHFEQCSSYASFCSTQSDTSPTNSDSRNIPPHSIFVDDINCHNFDQDHSSNADHGADNTEEQFPAVEVDDVDHFFNYPEAPFDVMSNTDDVTVGSIALSSDNSVIKRSIAKRSATLSLAKRVVPAAAP